MQIHDLAGMRSGELPPPGERGDAWCAVIAEDMEEHAALLIEQLKRLRPGWTIAPVVTDVAGLLEAVEDLVPNVLLLDVHLGGGKSIDIVGQLPYPVPIIFTTGDPTYAASAYECAAVDYLLKPVRAARLERALRRAESVAGPQAERPSAEATPLSGWLMAMRGNGHVVVHMKDILYLQARGKLTMVVTAEGESFIKRGLGVVEMHLDAARFRRVHRSTIVNIHHAHKVMRDDLGRMRISVRKRDEWLDVSQPFEHLFKPT